MVDRQSSFRPSPGPPFPLFLFSDSNTLSNVFGVESISFFVNEVGDEDSEGIYPVLSLNQFLSVQLENRVAKVSVISQPNNRLDLVGLFESQLCASRKSPGFESKPFESLSGFFENPTPALILL